MTNGDTGDSAQSAQAAQVAPLEQSKSRRRPVSVERAVQEGILIAGSAVVMDAKNYIIVASLRDGHPFDLDSVMANVQRQLLALSRENDENGRRVEQLAADIHKHGGAPDDSEGYQADDYPTLTRRAIVNLRIGNELKRLSDNEPFLAELAERARIAAWSDVGDAIFTRLLTDLPKPPDKFYEDDKAQRIRALFDINLRALERQTQLRRDERTSPTNEDAKPDE